MKRPAGGAARNPLAAAVLAAVVFASFGARAADSPPGPARLTVTLEFLAVGEGSRVLARRQEVLEVGMQATVDETLVRRGPDGPRRSRCRLVFRTGTAEDERVRLDVVSVIDDPGHPDGWRRERRLELALGTSSLVEVLPPDEAQEGLVVSFTVARAGLQRLTAVPVAVELLVGVSVVDGDREMVLQQPRLRTLAGSPATFSFDYPVPATTDGGVDHVRFDVSLTPHHPRDGVLPVRLELDGELPGPDGGAVHHDERRDLLAGQRWFVPVRSQQEGAGLRLEVTAFWRSLSPGP